MSTAKGRHSSLFRRIYGTFVVTVLFAAVLVGIGGWLVARALGTEWVGDALESVGENNDELAELVARPALLEQRIAAMAEELDTRIAAYDEHGDRLAGDGPERIPPRVQRHARRLERGRPVVQRNKLERPIVLAPIVDPASGRVVALLHVAGRPNPRIRIGLVLLVGVLVVMAAGAAALSRSLVRRIAALEHGVGRIAGGELQHRVQVPARLSDEIDELGVAVNEMARRLEQLVQGQRALLANVSHELRTPLSRIKVLLEILEERIDGLAVTQQARPSEPADLERVRRGLDEMATDVAEIETLIGDLLTSGRLDLSAGEGRTLDAVACPVDELLRKVGARFDVHVDAPEDLVVAGDALLLERLFSNLFANARRACPSGRIDAIARTEGDEVVVRVQDEGPGIAPADREVVFEPFRRLDDARSRDKGGVGLGLHLCRQICSAHGGRIAAQARPDGRTGACLVVRLPRTA